MEICFFMNLVCGKGSFTACLKLIYLINNFSTMRSVLLFLAAVAFTCTLQAQPENGPYTELHPAGQKAASGMMKNGKKDGEWKFWTANGVLIEVSNFRDGELDGKSSEYYGEKWLKKETNYRNGQRDGLTRLFDENGHLYQTKNYRNDELDGEYTEYTWYNNREMPLVKYNFRDGKKEGKYQEWHTNGQIRAEATFRSDTLFTDVEVTYSNGYKTKAGDSYYCAELRNTRIFAMLGESKFEEELELCEMNTYNNVQTYPDDQPEFIGGIAAMQKFISDSTRYPKRCKDAQLGGTVYVQFVVEKSGKTNLVRLVKGANNCPELNNEAIRLVQSMPKWKPGMMDGKKARCYYTIPVKFKPAG